MKDLSLLGRDLNNILIIDNVKENFQLHKENGIQIRNFEGEEDDIELQVLSIELKKVALTEGNFVSEIKKLQKIFQIRFDSN